MLLQAMLPGLHRALGDAQAPGDGGGLEAFLPQGDQGGFLLGGGHGGHSL
jgi:hypothetical protein